MTTIKTFAQKFSNDWSMNMVSLLTCNLLTTIFPLVLAMLTAALYVFGSLSPQAFHAVVAKMSSALPSSVSVAINLGDLQKNVVRIRGPLALISLAGLVWGGANLFSSLEDVFSIFFRTQGRAFLPQKLMAMGMVVILAILLPLSLAASSLVTAGSSAFRAVLPQPATIVLSIVGPLTSLFVLWVLFLVIYMVVPTTKVPFRIAWRGAAAAALLFALFDLLFPLYFKVFLNGNGRYGAVAASLVVLIAWLWFFALITVIGAQINAVAMGIKPTRHGLPRTLAREYKHEMASIRESRTSTPSPSPSKKSQSLARPLYVHVLTLGLRSLRYLRYIRW
jgi:membrane protein